jgi:DNA-directed RNA polymerase subunit alpha
MVVEEKKEEEHKIFLNRMSIIKPNKLITNYKNNSSRVMNVVAEPLERGFGVTLGNALRRVLLSSLQGAAVTFIKISGVSHEFQSIHGVKEDVTDIILNIKSMVIKMSCAEPQVIKLKAEGPCVVKASMIQLSSDVSVVDPDHVICTLETDSSIDLEMICEVGRGYLSSALISEKSIDSSGINLYDGYMAIDAIFSPIRSVLYKVDNTRVGQATDYDKLTMTIETNGSMNPSDALSLASKILQDQFSLFLIANVQEYKVEDIKTNQTDMKFHPVLLKKLLSFELSVRCRNCLNGDNIIYVGDLVQKAESELLKLPNFGKKSLDEINQLLDNLNREFFYEKEVKNKINNKNVVNFIDQKFSLLSLGMKISEWNKDTVEDLIKKYDNFSCQ